MSEYSGNPAQTGMGNSESSNGKLARPNVSDTGNPLMVDSFSGSAITIDDAIQMHLIDCDQCRAAVNGRPLGNIQPPTGSRDKHCGQYWQLQLMRAEYEGKVNNIVSHTEDGWEDNTQGRLQ